MKGPRLIAAPWRPPRLLLIVKKIDSSPPLPPPLPPPPPPPPPLLSTFLFKVVCVLSLFPPSFSL